MRGRAQHASFVGQTDGAGGALEQPQAELPFELLDQVADGGLRRMQRRRGLREVRGFRH